MDETSEDIYRTPEQRLGKAWSWTLISIASLFALVIAIKVLRSPLQLDLSAFGFSDLLALILAVFAIWLSVRFYHMSAQTSQAFYRDTFVFSKQVTEILSRIETGFGEQLRHIEGYVVDMPKALSEAKEGIISQGQVVTKAQEDIHKVFEELAQRANLNTEEKHEVLSKLRQKEDELTSAQVELATAQEELERLSLQLRVSTTSSNAPSRHSSLHSLNVVAAEWHLAKALPGEYFLIQDSAARREMANKAMRLLTLNEIDLLHGEGIVDTNNQLTDYGLVTVRAIRAGSRPRDPN